MGSCVIRIGRRLQKHKENFLNFEGILDLMAPFRKNYSTHYPRTRLFISINNGGNAGADLNIKILAAVREALIPHKISVEDSMNNLASNQFSCSGIFYFWRQHFHFFSPTIK